MKYNRLKDIEEYILYSDTVSLDKLCEAFSVSKNTIRRDIQKLVDKGSIKKIYGGVISNEKKIIAFEERNVKYISEKILIAKLSATFIEDGDIIFIDSGTTTINIIDFLKDKKNVTILTDNLKAIIKAFPYDNLNIISIGGSLIKKTNCFTGVNTLELLKKYNINKAFMAATGISIVKGVSDSSPLEHEIKKLVVEQSDEVFLPVDSSKFNVSSLMTYCNLNDIDHLITNEEPSPEYLKYFKENNVKITVPNYHE